MPLRLRRSLTTSAGIFRLTLSATMWFISQRRSRARSGPLPKPYNAGHARGGPRAGARTHPPDAGLLSPGHTAGSDFDGGCILLPVVHRTIRAAARPHCQAFLDICQLDTFGLICSPKPSLRDASSAPYVVAEVRAGAPDIEFRASHVRTSARCTAVAPSSGEAD